MSFFVCGDTHCDIDIQKLTSRCFDAKNLNKSDYVLICGDFGCVWDGWKSDKYIQRWYDKKPWTTLFVDGNHENHDLLNEYPLVQWNGGLVHKISDSIIHLTRGQVYTINDRKVFTFGGASSHDVEWRTAGVNWWYKEMPSVEEFSQAKKNLSTIDNKVDYVFTHCASSKTQSELSCMYKTDRLTEFFDEIENELSFKHWFFGHYHRDFEIDDRHTVVYRRVIQLW